MRWPGCSSRLMEQETWAPGLTVSAQQRRARGRVSILEKRRVLRTELDRLCQGSSTRHVTSAQRVLSPVDLWISRGPRVFPL